jgi:hypothetical protein
VDISARYLELSRLGKIAFVNGAAPAALVRRRGEPLRQPRQPITTLPFDGDDSTIVGFDHLVKKQKESGDTRGWEIYPLEKKSGAPFSDMITIGRTGNNDVVLNDVTISRFHAFFKDKRDMWVVCDAGSKNGTAVDGSDLEARKEAQVNSGQTVRLGDVDVEFYTAGDLYDVLSGDDTIDGGDTGPSGTGGTGGDTETPPTR